MSGVRTHAYTKACLQDVRVASLQKEVGMKEIFGSYEFLKNAPIFIFPKIVGLFHRAEKVREKLKGIN